MCSGRSHASSAARFFIFMLLGVIIKQPIADAASHFEYTRLFSMAHQCRRNPVQHTPGYVVSNTCSLVPRVTFFYGTASPPRPARHIGQDRSHLGTSSCSTPNLGMGRLATPSIANRSARMGRMAGSSQKTSTQNYQVLYHTSTVSPHRRGPAILRM